MITGNEAYPTSVVEVAINSIQRITPIAKRKVNILDQQVSMKPVNSQLTLLQTHQPNQNQSISIWELCHALGARWVFLGQA
jgi:hypothetical protein